MVNQRNYKFLKKVISSNHLLNLRKRDLTAAHHPLLTVIAAAHLLRAQTLKLRGRDARSITFTTIISQVEEMIAGRGEIIKAAEEMTEKEVEADEKIVH